MTVQTPVPSITRATPGTSVSPLENDIFGVLNAAPGVIADQMSADLAWAERIARNANSANTKRAYRTTWAQYVRYCESLGLEPLAGDPQIVSLFLSSLHRAGKKLSTIQTHLAAISTAHRLAGVEINLKHRTIRTFLQGLKRELGVRPIKEAAPLLSTALREFLRSYPSEGPIDCRNRAMILIGFGAALRRSEIVAIDLSDVKVTPDGLTVNVKRSKTDQYGAGTTLAIYRSADPELCIVTVLDAWLQHRGRGDGPLFTQIRRGDHVKVARLTDRTVWNVIRGAIEKLGWQNSGISPHSLRAGLITSAALNGAPLDEIMEQSRHRSYQVARKYVRNADAWKRNVTKLIFAAPAAPEQAGQAPSPKRGSKARFSILYRDPDTKIETVENVRDLDEIAEHWDFTDNHYDLMAAQAHATGSFQIDEHRKAVRQGY
jgi:integrase